MIKFGCFLFRHYSLQNTHDKSQSANNLSTFVDSMQLTVSEPNALNQLSEPKGLAASASSSYFPLEPTMEECMDSLDISYDAAESVNNSQRKIDAFSENEEDAGKAKENYLFDESDLFANLFSKNSSELDLFLSTLNAFTQKKSKLVELLKSLSGVKGPRDEAKGMDELNQVWSNLVSQMGDEDKGDARSSSDAEGNQLGTMLQRCQSSMGGEGSTLGQQIDASLQEMDDEEEIIRDSAIADENETDENVEEEFMDEEMDNEKMHEVNFDAGLQRMRELKRRHAAQHYKASDETHQMLSHQHHHHDEFVLKCQFSALIPAFDPRPGKNNINQIQDISVPAQTAPVATEPLEPENKTS